jgi:catalase
MTEPDRVALIDNISGHLKNAKKFIQERQIKVFTKVNTDYGLRVSKKIGLSMGSFSKF